MKKSRSEPVIYTKESLQQEQRRLKLIIKQQEADLRQRVQKLPGEVLYAGVDAVLPAVLTGKISNKILTAGKNFVNKTIIKKDKWQYFQAGYGGKTGRYICTA